MTVLLLLLALLVVLLSGIPVGIGIALVGVGFALLHDGSLALTAMPQIMFSSTNSFLITAIPLFVMMSEILRRAGVTELLFEMVTRWLGHLPGGLAVSTVVTSAIGASITGSSIANAASMSMVATKPMLDRGYDPKFVFGLIAASGTLGILIPPSIPLLLYGAITDVSVGRLFAAGMLPGLLLTAILVGYVVARSLLGGVYVPMAKATWAARWEQSRKASWALVLPAIVIGGIYVGVFTATEAAGAGVFYALFLGLFVYRSLSLKDIPLIVMDTLQTTSMILLIVAGATVLGHSVTTMQVSQEMLRLIEAFNLPAWGFVLSVMILLLILGCILEVISIIYILVPVLFPMLVALDVDPVWFAILFVVNMEIALVTPPVGMVLFVIAGIVKRPIIEVIQGVVPFIVVLLLFLVLLMLVPWISTAIPDAIM